MKKIKVLMMGLMVLVLLTGCFKRDTMDNINIYTTVYPIEYLIDNIYGNNSNIDSIYPNGINPKTYQLTDKQIKEYAKSDMFIYNGLTEEKQIAGNFLENNKNIKFIDVSKGLTYQHKEEELWLYPSNYLMLAQNMKDKLLEYTNSALIKDEIEESYSNLKLTISKYDADLKLIAENANNKTIIVGNDALLFLAKYGFKVINIEENDEYVSNDYQEAKNLINAKTVSYVFVLDNDELNENTKSLESAGAKIAKVPSMINRSDKESAEDYDYTKMMNTFIDLIKAEVNG